MKRRSSDVVVQSSSLVSRHKNGPRGVDPLGLFLCLLIVVSFATRHIRRLLSHTDVSRTPVCVVY